LARAYYDRSGARTLPLTKTNPKAQGFFDQGVAQMHSFWAVEGGAFIPAGGRARSEAPMPQWGIAMVAAGITGQISA